MHDEPISRPLPATAVAAVLAALFASGAMAQEGGTQLQLAPVVVSGTRVEQPSFDLPMSIDSLDAGQIRDGQMQVNASEALARVPGIVAQNRQNYAQDLQISSRGFGARSTFGVRGVRLYADGIPATMPDGQGQAATFNLGSAKRIEVMRGPFSVLYGNSGGGVVQIFTEDGAATPTLDASLAAGSYGTVKVGGRLSGSNGALGYVVDLSRFETNGYRDHSTATRDHLNAKFKYRLGADTTLTLLANVLEQPETRDPLGLTKAQADQNPEQAGLANDGRTAQEYNTRKSISHAQGGLVLEHRLGPQDSLHLMGYAGNRDVIQYQSITRGFQLANLATHPGGVIDFDRDFGGVGARWTHKGQLAGAPYSLTAGIDYDVSDERRKGYNNFVGTTLGVKGDLRRDEDDRVTSLDEYLQLQWEPSTSWLLTGGLRHSKVSFNSADHYVVGINPDDSGSASYTNTSPVAGVVYRVSPTLNLYGNMGRGFETPTFNELFYKPDGSTGLNLALRPSRSRHYEAGVKSFLNADTRLNAALFRIDTEDEIVVATSAGGRTTYRNAGKTRRDGVELSLESELGKGFSAYAAYAYLDARFKGDALDGKKLPGVPGTTLHAELAWKNGTGFSTAVEGHWSGEVQVVDTNADPAASRYGLLNWRAVYEHKLGSARLKGFLRIDNLLDERYIGSVIVGETNKRYYEPAPGRNFSIGLNLNLPL